MHLAATMFAEGAVRWRFVELKSRTKIPVRTRESARVTFLR